MVFRSIFDRHLKVKMWYDLHVLSSNSNDKSIETCDKPNTFVFKLVSDISSFAVLGCGTPSDLIYHPLEHSYSWKIEFSGKTCDWLQTAAETPSKNVETKNKTSILDQTKLVHASEWKLLVITNSQRPDRCLALKVHTLAILVISSVQICSMSVSNWFFGIRKMCCSFQCKLIFETFAQHRTAWSKFKLLKYGNWVIEQLESRNKSAFKEFHAKWLPWYP